MCMRKEDFIGFYHEYDAYGCFSDWYPARFKYGRNTYASSEQYMMYQKMAIFHQWDSAAKIMNTSDPGACKKIAAQPFPQFNAKLWDKVSYQIVKQGVRAKFIQNPDIMNILLSTSDALLAECAPNDRKWGIGLSVNDPDCLDVKNWQGKNYLGRILMEVREELRTAMELSPDHRLVFVNAMDLDPIPEWNRTAGELRMIPQYYNVIHAYSDTLPGNYERDCFYNNCSLYEWETAMRTNMGGGLPAAMFWEMKQEVYDIARIR